MASDPTQRQTIVRAASRFSPYGELGATDEGRALLQARVAMCWKGGGLLAGGFLILFLVFFLRGSARGLHQAILANLVGSILPLATWLLLRGRPRGFWTIALLDLITGLVVLSVYALTFALAPMPAVLRPDLLMILITSALVTVRGIVIPTSARHSLVAGAVATLPALALSAAFHWKHPLGGTEPFAQSMALAGLWCSTPVAIAYLASRVIHGLRTEVAEARQLGQYVLDQKIGEGGMGMVYRAHHSLLRRPTAIKLLLPDRVGPVALARFEREVQLTATLTHPNTVSIFDYGRTPNGIFYYAMEYLEGINLQSLVERFGPQPPARVVHLLTQVCGSLGEAHARGLVHRDVKPANVIVCERGGVLDTVKVLDFGLVKEVGVPSTAPLTQAQSIIGTPLYMSPEALRAGPVDARTDVYAVGAVAYFLLTGHPVFEAGSMLEICAKHLDATPEAPSARLGAKLPEDLEALILRCLAKDLAERPASGAAVGQALRACAVPGWTEDDARRWWAARGKPVVSVAGELGSDPTLPAEA